MTPYFPIIELVDRYAIAKLKQQKTQANNGELDFYSDQLSGYNLDWIQKELQELFEVHSQIWSLEAELKSGREHELELAEIGRRAIAIRDLNHHRIALKNRMADILGQGHVKEIKQDHLSE
jgi:hypothetical protein